ncbi:hypothetical protein [Neisseria sp. Marseille-Q2251]|jgi:hypothetical protein|uniref:hypothetical protein n=1 Tax=Neisseria sp. Marseille-Q2251 TaxID=2866585 RepID=UPI0031392B87
MDDDFQNNPAYDYLPQNNFHGLFDENKPANGTQILRVILRKAFIAWILLCIYLWFRLP